MSYIELQEENETLKQQIKEYEDIKASNDIVFLILLTLSAIGMGFMILYFNLKKRV